MKQMFEEMQARLEKGQNMVLVSIVKASGSSPRGAGARMLVAADGRLYGTVGGGAVEMHAIELAKTLLNSGEPVCKKFELHRGAADDIGMVCGGDVELLFQPIAGHDPQWQQVAAAALAALASRMPAWFLEPTSGPAACPSLYNNGKLLAGATVDDAVLAALTGSAALQLPGYFAEPLPVDGRVIIFGGGHVCQQLVPVLARLDFRMVVFENRAEFSQPQLFPGADAVILGDYQDVAASVSIQPDDYVVVMTNGHAHDCVVEGQALRAKPAYLGVIGSKAKIAAVNKILLAEGFSQAQLDTVYTPIGIAIKAQTPAEIAISIAAELILVRAERHAGDAPAGCPMQG